MLATRAQEVPRGARCRHVPEAGWAGKKNGDLLHSASGTIDVFVTIDNNLVHQQAVHDLLFGVVVLKARSNRLADLVLFVPAILDAIAKVAPGEALTVGD
jgi:hypothetical protein